MNKTFFILLIMLPALAFGWAKMQPLVSCEEFYFEYQSKETEEGLRWEIRFPTNINYNQFDILPYTLGNISNLESLSQEINNRAPIFCSNIEELNLDLVKCVSSSNQSVLNTDFFEFSKNILAFFPDEIRTCEDIYNLDGVGADVEKLAIKDLEKKDLKNRADFKLAKFLFKSQKETIDFFASCGGRKFSKDFIRNMIITEAKNECMFPPPQGYLSFDEVVKIASNIAKDYDNKTLVQLNKNYDAIIAKSYQQFTDSAVRRTIADNMGLKLEDPQVQKMMDDSQEYKYLKKKIEVSKKDLKIKNKADQFNDQKKMTKEEHISSYITEIFAPKITFEIADDIISSLVKKEFIDSLPSDMNNDGLVDQQDQILKNNYIDEKILPQILNGYNTCIQPSKEHLKIGDLSDAGDISSSSIESINIKDQVAINERKKTRCSLHPQSCKETENTNSCQSGPGLFKDPDLSEINKIQSCAIKSILDSMPRVIDQIILSTLKGIEKDQEIKFDESFYKTTSEKSSGILLSCLDNKIKSINGTGIYKDSKINADAFDKISSSTVSSFVKDCTDIIEEKVGLDVILATVSKLEIVSSSYKSLYPELTDEQINNMITILVTPIYDQCLTKQNYILTQDPKTVYIKSKDVMMCVPMIEMKVASEIVSNYTKEKMIELKLIANANDSNINLDQFKVCTDQAINNSINKIGSKTAPDAIVDEKSADDYLKVNPEYYNCVKTVINEIVYDAGKQTYLDIVESKEVIKDKRYAKSLANDVAANTKACFSKKLDEVGNWTNLKNLFTHDNVPQSESVAQFALAPISISREEVKIAKPKGGFDLIMDDCIKEVEVDVTVKIVKNETNNQLNDLVKDSLLIKNNKKNQVQSILTLAMSKLKNHYQIVVPDSIPQKEINDYIMTKALELDQKTNGSTDQSLALYEEYITDFTLQTVRSNFLIELAPLTKLSSTKFKNFEDSLSLSCVKNLYKNLTKDKAQDNTPKKETNVSELKKTILDVVSKGLNFLNELGDSEYASKMREIRKFCANSSNVDSIEDLLATDAFDFVIKAQISTGLQTELQAGVDTLLIDNINAIDKNILTTLKNTLVKQGLIKSSTPLTAKLIAQYIPVSSLENQANTGVIKLKYALEQYKSSSVAIEKWINDPKTLNKILFNDKKIMDFAKVNISQLLIGSSEDEAAKNIKSNLSVKIMEKLFEDTSKTSFASDFTESIMIGGIGGQGIDSAIQSAGDQAANEAYYGLKTEAKNNAQYFVKELWARPSTNSDSVKKYLRLDQMSDTKRSELAKSVLNNALIPAAKGESANQDKITSDFTKYTSDYDINGKNFEDMVSDYVTPKTTSATKADAVRQLVVPVIITSPILSPLLLLFK